MKRLAFLVVLAALALAPAFASAQLSPSPSPSPACSCEFCYYNQQVTCYSPVGSGQCAMYGYLFCDPWWNPGQNLAPVSWRPLDLGDSLFAERARAEAMHDHAVETLEADASLDATADQPMPSFGADV